MVKKIILLGSALFALNAVAQDGEKTPSKPSQEYPAPVTLENLSEKDKKNPDRVGEALANTFLQMMETKQYSEDDIARSSRVLTMMSCMQFNRKRQMDSKDPSNSKWRVKAEWLGADDSSLSEVVEVTAINRDLASGYALCALWSDKHIPINRFTGFYVEKIEQKSEITSDE